MDKCSFMCENYARRIGNEIGWLGPLIDEGIKHFNNGYFNTPWGKVSLIDLNIQAYYSLHKMQVVYLVNLFETFMQDFIGIKDGLSETDMEEKDFWKNYLSTIISDWNSYQTNKAINNSTSFMNIRYSLFVLEKKYNLKFPSYLTPLVPELGSLRNCLVHYDGELLHKDKGGYLFNDTLSETLKFLEVGDTVKILTDINRNNYINTITSDLQTFVNLCGGRITRPIDHKNETPN